MGQAVALHSNGHRRTGSAKTDIEAQNKASPMPKAHVVFVAYRGRQSACRCSIDEQR
jgi:hypothetical protein